MDLNKHNTKKIIGIITFAILLLVGVQHLDIIMGFILNIFEIVFPFVIGVGIAFILNVPMRGIENGIELPIKVRKRMKRIVIRVMRPFSLLITLFLVIGIILLVVFLIVPEIKRTFEIIRDSNLFPEFLEQLEKKYNAVIEQYPDISNAILIKLNWEQLWENMLTFIKNSTGIMIESTFGIASSILGGLINFFLGFIFAIYILLQKEKLGQQLRKLTYAYLPERAADKLLSVCALSSLTFSKFLSGQCLEAVILGSMFFLAMNIFAFPYTLMISVLIAFTALIPVFGTFIGCFVGTFLILIVNPLQALWFVILFLILQQIEGNFIYPHVVGGSVGLPSIWVLVAVTIGGSVMGVAGMLIFIPMASVFYTLLKKAVNDRIKMKKIQPDKYN